MTVRLENLIELPPMPRQNIGEPYASILKDPQLFERIDQELDKKIMGEKKARRAIFLITCGRLMRNCEPTSTNLLVNDESGKGKDHVTKNVLSLWPKDDIHHQIRISPTAFTYWHRADYEPQWSWDNKVVYLEDLSQSVLNCDALKTMASAQKYSINYSTITVNKNTDQIPFNGKPCLILTMAESAPIREILRRFPILSLEGGDGHTFNVMKFIAQKKNRGILPQFDPDITNALGSLVSVNVVIPFGDKIAEYLKNESSHFYMTFFSRIVDFIGFSAVLHQYQRKFDHSGNVMAEKQDYEIAREVILSFSTSKSSIGLTKNQRRLIEALRGKPLRKASDILIDYPEISRQKLYDNLDVLREMGIVREIVERDDILHRDVSKFELIGDERLTLPSWEDLNSEVSHV